MEQIAITIKEFFSARKNQSYLFIFACFLTALIVKKSGFEWKWCHLFFSYEFGFLKRGLIGQLFRTLSISTSWDNFAIFSTLMLTGVIFAFHNLIKNVSTRAFLAFALLFVCTPVLLRNLSHDWGRFDQIALAFIFVLLLCTENIKQFRALLCLSPLLLFIHEATAVWALPTILAITFLTDRKSVYFITPVIIICGACILAFGGLNMDPDVYGAKLVAWASPIPIYPTVISTLTESTQSSIATSLPVLATNIHTKEGITAIGILLSFIASLFFIKDKVVVGFAILSLLSACVLFIVALDHFRWVSLMCFIVLFYLLYAHQKNLIRNKNAFYYYLMTLSILGLFFNPIGIYQPY